MEASTYYQQNRERILKYNKERYWKLKLQDKDKTIEQEIKYLRKRIDSLQQNVEYYKQKARAYRKERMEANAKTKTASVWTEIFKDLNPYLNIQMSILPQWPFVQDGLKKADIVEQIKV